MQKVRDCPGEWKASGCFRLAFVQWIYNVGECVSTAKAAVMEGKTRRAHEETFGDIIMDFSQEEVISHCQSQKSE